MQLYDGLAAHTHAVRLFICERRAGLPIDVVPLDMVNLENRRAAYRRRVSARGEAPALRLDDGRVITEVTAIYEYLDEVATGTTITAARARAGGAGGGGSLFGADAAERAETRMRLRRADLEIVLPVVRWWRDGPEAIDYYRGHRLPNPDGRHVAKIEANRGLNLLEDELEGELEGEVMGGGGEGARKPKTWLCGERFSAADVHLYGVMKPMLQAAAWVDVPGRPNVAGWFARMEAREASKEALMPFAAGRIFY